MITSTEFAVMSACCFVVSIHALAFLVGIPTPFVGMGIIGSVMLYWTARRLWHWHEMRDIRRLRMMHKANR